MKSQGKHKKVFVGMSGGVDSSVSAALLKKAGYDVTGVFIKVWQPDWITCTWKEDRLDAMRVAAQLDIPFITLDLEKEYKQEVVDYMVAEYKAGRTPNPDVMCNRYVKFGGFYNWAMKQGADFVATGHYARVERSEKVASRGRSLSERSGSEASSAGRREGTFSLLMGDDPNKDQTYFLWTLTSEQLKHVLFPVGNIEKPEVRKLAKKFKLATADKKDSQGLCFIGKIDVKEFLSHYITEKRGDVLDVKGNVIGYHDGAFFYTIGERHGFTITKKTPHDEAQFVIAKDVEKNTLTVAPKINDVLPNGKTKTELREANWIVGFPGKNFKAKARSRYREMLQDITIINEKTVEFKDPQFTLSPGQSLVIYNGSQCLGGGIIAA